MQFLDSITFPYDDATKRHILSIYKQKESLLDSEIIQEHLLNQPVLCFALLLIAAVSVATFLFSSVFIACRALGNCGAKRYQTHPTSSRRYVLYLPLLIVSWIGLAGATIHFLTAGASYWQQNSDKDSHNHETARTHSLHVISRRDTQERNVYQLFVDSDYDGDFEQLSGSTIPAFVTMQPKSSEKMLAPNLYAPMKKNRHLPIKMLKLITTTVPPRKKDTFVFHLGPGKIVKSYDSNSIVDKPFRLMRPNPKSEKHRHFIKAIHGPFVWDRQSDAGAQAVYRHRHDLENKTMDLLSSTSQMESSRSIEKGDDLILAENHSNEIFLNLKIPEKGDTASLADATVIERPLGAVGKFSTSVEELDQGGPKLARSNSSIHVDPLQKGAPNKFGSSSQELQELLELPSESTVVLATLWPLDVEVATAAEHVETSTLLQHMNESLTLKATILLKELGETTDPSASQEMTISSLDENNTMSTSETATATLSTIAATIAELSTTKTTTATALTTTTTSSSSTTTTTTTTTRATTALTTKRRGTTTTTSATTTTTTPTTRRTTLTTLPPFTTATTTVASTSTLPPTFTSTETTTTTTTTASVSADTTPVTTAVSTTNHATSGFHWRTQNLARRRQLEREEQKIGQSSQSILATGTNDNRPPHTINESIPVKSIKDPVFIEVVGAVPQAVQERTPRTGPMKEAGFQSDNKAIHSRSIQSQFFWATQISMGFIGTVMIILLLPIPLLVTAGSVCYMRSYHPMDRTAFSERIGQCCVILATLLLFFIPLLYIYLDIMLLYIHIYNAMCPTLQSLSLYRASISGEIPSVNHFLTGVRQNCQRSLEPLEDMWCGCLAFVIFSMPTVIALFKLSKYYLRMKSEYYWTVCDGYGVIRPKVASTNDAMYGHVYGTLRRPPASQPPPVRPYDPIYGIYIDQPIYTAFQRI